MYQKPLQAYTTFYPHFNFSAIQKICIFVFSWSWVFFSNPFSNNMLCVSICSFIAYYSTSHSSPNYSSLFILIVHTLNTLLVHKLTWLSSEHRTMLNLPILTLFTSEIMNFFSLLQLSPLKLASSSLGGQFLIPVGKMSGLLLRYLVSNFTPEKGFFFLSTLWKEILHWVCPRQEQHRYLAHCHNHYVTFDEAQLSTIQDLHSTYIFQNIPWN